MKRRVVLFLLFFVTVSALAYAHDPDLLFFRDANVRHTAELWFASLDGEVWQAADLVKLGEARWSWDGEHLAFLRIVPPNGQTCGPKEAGEKCEDEEIWVAAADGSMQRLVIASPLWPGSTSYYLSHMRDLQWVPDGAHLYISAPSCPTNRILFSLSLDRQELESVTSGYSFRVHANGIITGIARGPMLFVDDLAGDYQETFAEEFGPLWHAVFSSSGRWALTVNYGSMMLLDCKARVSQTLFSHFNDVDASWAPTETRFSFVSDWDGDQEVYIYDLNTGAITQITDNDYDDYAPVWSSDGAFIAYISENEVFSSVWIYSLKNEASFAITHGEGEDLYPIWRSRSEQ